jgi:hypothetical protein
VYHRPSYCQFLDDCNERRGILGSSCARNVTVRAAKTSDPAVTRVASILSPVATPDGNDSSSLYGMSILDTYDTARPAARCKPGPGLVVECCGHALRLEEPEHDSRAGILAKLSNPP